MGPRASRRQFDSIASLDDRLRLVAQPIFHLKTGNDVAGELVPLITRRGPWRAGVEEVDGWLLERAAYVAAHSGPVHVNLSAQSVRDPRFASRASAALARAGTEADLVMVEIDESTAANEAGVAEEFVRAMNRIGVRVAVADFALRHDDLSYLDEVRYEVLKLDPWLVGGAVCDERSARVIRDAVEQARARGMWTIAEGVYDDDVRLVLCELGVDCGQGFYRQRVA